MLQGRSDRAKGVFPHWIKTREIRIVWEEGIARATAIAVAEAIRERLEEVGLTGFSVQLWGTGWKEGRGRVLVSDYIAPALDQKGGVKYDKLFKLSYHESYRQVRQHADIYITERPFEDDSVSWGAAMFEYGCSVLTLHGGRQRNRTFLKNVVRHEVGHLLGMPLHCDDVNVVDVDLLRYRPECNMHYSVPSADLCPKCLFFIHEWWNTIAQHT
jgi:hypothetical protein